MENQQQAEILLAREASLSSMSLGLGLTQLRKYDFVKPGFFYSSMFMITIGLERLMKMIVIYEHRINNQGQFPSNNQLKNDYGHKINDLYKRALEINTKYNCLSKDTELLKDDIFGKNITFLSDFAQKARYYNLDSLTGKDQYQKEPLNRWNEEINSIIISRHYRPKKSKLDQINSIAEKMEDITYVMLTSENGENITSLKEFYIEGDKVTTKQKYSMYYIYVMTRFLVNLLSDLEAQGSFYPYLREYFSHLLCRNKAYVLSRKTWLPIGH